MTSVHLSYVLYGFAFANAFNLYHPLVFNGDSLWTTRNEKNCRFKNKSVMIAQDGVFATWVYNTMFTQAQDGTAWFSTTRYGANNECRIHAFEVCGVIS